MVHFNQILAAALSVVMLGPAFPRAVSAQDVPKNQLTQAQIDAALRRASADDEAARNEIRDVLTSDGVRRLAKSAGVDPAYVEKAAGFVDTLEGEDLERAASYATELSDRLSGGDTVHISIGLVSLLLIIIIIILLAK